MLINIIQLLLDLLILSLTFASSKLNTMSTKMEKIEIMFLTIAFFGNIALAIWCYQNGSYKTAMFNSFCAGWNLFCLITKLI